MNEKKKKEKKRKKKKKEKKKKKKERFLKYKNRTLNGISLLIFHNILFAIHNPVHLNSELNTVVFCCRFLYNEFIGCNSETND